MIRILSSVDYKNDIRKVVVNRSLVENHMGAVENCNCLTKAIFDMYRVSHDPERSKEFLKAKRILSEKMANVIISLNLIQDIYRISDVELESLIRGQMYQIIQKIGPDDE